MPHFITDTAPFTWEVPEGSSAQNSGSPSTPAALPPCGDALLCGAGSRKIPCPLLLVKIKLGVCERSACRAVH